MIMPFVRLVAIYVIVILGVVAFFKRDQLMQMSSAGFGWPASQTAAEGQDGTNDNAPAGDALAQPTANPTADPAPQTARAELPAIQMPVADSEETTATPAQTSTAPAAATPESTATSTDTATNTDTGSRLSAARQAYWQGDLAGSEALYAALARDLPDNPDVTGEFGNILFARQRFDAAAEAYLTTGKLLVSLGEVQRAQPIIAVLQNIAPQKAATLRALAGN